MDAIPLNERLAALKSDAVGLRDATLDDVFQGAARLSEIYFLEWELHAIQHEWKLSKGQPYFYVVDYARNQLRAWEVMPDDEDRDYYVDSYFWLMFRTAIQPFALIEHQKQRRKLKEEK